ncbi:MCE family protein [Rhodococcus sp. MSC1_016]|uniref:MCE family protein n=1 Tax=Rhodococcus sp. MSC1_016 TaxID=2909266 RepID=UPI00202E2056|nr:MCE family protein [Rhodococcus sp. MSC1_016]
MTTRTRHSQRLPLLGLVAVVTVGALVAAAIAQFNQAFTRSEIVTLMSPRAGLLMESGAAVKLRGVPVGRVGNIDVDADGARLQLNIDPDRISEIPGDIQARIVPPTVFGVKFVDLISDTEATPANHLRPNTILSTDDVTVELNSTFDVVMKALAALDPQKLNTALGSVARSVDGKGDQISAIMRKLDEYLNRFNPNLPAVVDTLPAATEVVHDYSQSFPPLIETMSNVGITSETVTERQAQFGAFWLSMTKFGNDNSDFLRNNGGRLITTLDVLEPTVGVLERYSPVVPCLVAGSSYNADQWRAVMGGPGYGGVQKNMSAELGFVPGLPAYEYPRDLPKTGVDTGPNCHGLPRANPNGVPYVAYDTGANPYPDKANNIQIGWVQLGQFLFGDLGTKGAGNP